jgi:flagellar motor switch protein FliN/FliY
MKETSFYASLSKIPKELYQLDTIPLTQTKEMFDLQTFAEELATRFHIDSLKISIGMIQWISSGDIEKGLGTSVVSTSITLSPITPCVLWLINSRDITKLCSFLLPAKPKKVSFSSDLLEESFYQYALLECLDALENQELFKNFSLKIDGAELTDVAGYLSVNIKLMHKRKTVWGRIVLSPEFLSSWRNHIANTNALTPTLAKSYSLVLGIDMASTVLSVEEMNKLSKGDFVLLDHVFYHPMTKQGFAYLTLQGQPLLSIKIENGRYQIHGAPSLISNPSRLDNHFPQQGHNMEHSEESSPKEEAISIHKAPVTIAINLARITMTLEKLTQLEPGNFLELPENNQTVSLSMNGENIGSAELIYLGDALGIRILSLGKTTTS